jgi:uncharacterized protein (TIGR02246 family)
MNLRRKILGACLLVWLSCFGARSDEPPRDKNAEPVEKAFAALAAALNTRDPKAFGEQFTPKGEFIDADGDEFEGREAISREFKALFEVNPRDTAKLDAEEIREINAGVLSVDGVLTYSSGNGSESDKVDFAALLVRQPDGAWLIASIRSQGERGLSSPHARLKEVEWLIGDWVDESDESTVLINNRWSEDGNFVVTKFAIEVGGRKVMSGTQWIGWDGSLEKLRSWVFDSEGGHATGVWTELDDRWIVKSSGVRPDGDACSATHTYERKGPDAFLFSITDRIIGDEEQTDFTSSVVRKPPEPKTTSDSAITPRGK